MLNIKWTQASRLLQESPCLARQGRYSGTQEWAVSGIPYTVWFRVNERLEQLEILRVLHNARQWPESV